MTGGDFPHSISATRAILKQVDIEGAYVLDIGAMEGFFSILSCRRRAAAVMATDRYDYRDKVALVQRTLGVEFEYAPGLALNQVHARIQEVWGRLADVVILSGVLYHMFDPMGGLVRVRGLVRPNGLVIVETVAAVSDTSRLLWNDPLTIYGPGTYFVPTTAALGSMMPFVGLTPIDCRYFVFGSHEGLPLCRIAVCCRAVGIPALSDPLPLYALGQYAWYADYVKMDFGEFLDLQALGSQDCATVGYRAESGFEAGDGSENPLRKENVFERSALEADPKSTRLGLNDVF